MKLNYIYRNKYSFIEKPLFYGKDPTKPSARGSPTYAQLGQGASGRHSALTTRCRTAITKRTVLLLRCGTDAPSGPARRFPSPSPGARFLGISAP